MAVFVNPTSTIAPLAGVIADVAPQVGVISKPTLSQQIQTNNNTTNNKINQTKRQTKQTRLSHVKTSGRSALPCKLKKEAFRRRLVSPGPNPVEIQILSSGNAILVPQPRSFFRTRLNILREICNVPGCRFNRMPKAVLYKLGYDVNNINKIIDQTYNSKVGGLPDTVCEPDEIIQGTNTFGDGYYIKNHKNMSRVEILISFNRAFKNIYMCRYILDLKLNKTGQPVDVMVSLVKAYGKTPGQYYCKPFLLSSRLDVKQFNAKIFLASIFEKVDDYSDFYGIYFGKLFRQKAPIARAAIQKACLHYLHFMRRKIGTTQVPKLPVDVPKPVINRQHCKVTHYTRRNGFEFFVVKFNDGTEHKIINGRYAIKEMFNLTLTNGFYYIHPMCYTPTWSRFESCSNRYCWIPAFAKANLRMPRDLIPFPELNYGYLVQCGLGKILNGRLKKITENYFHFDVLYDEKPQFVKFGSKIGVKLDNDADGIIKNIEILFDDISAGIISGSNLRSDNPLLNTITSHLSNQINKQCSRAKDLAISTCLSSKQKREMSELFPEINFDFTETSFSTHALATAMRHAENFLMAQKYDFQNFIDAGGDITHYLHKLVSNVHVCSPVVDIKDAHRHTTRSNKLDRMKGLCENVSMCENLTQECRVQKPNIVAVEVYDMTLTDFARALLSHNAKRVDFSLIIPPEIYDEDCDVALFDDSINVRCEDNAVFYSYGGSGEVYQHDRENLKQILATQIFEVDGVIFKKTLESSRKQLHFFSIVPCHDMMNGKYVTESHYVRSELDKLCIRVPIEDELKTVQHQKIKIDKACFHNLVEYAMNTVLRLDEKAFEYILSQYRARKSISIRGGKVTQVGADMHPKAVSSLIGAIAGYGLRLREQSHRAAKIAYTEYYNPSLFRMICKILAFLLKKLNNWTHEFMMNVIKFLTPRNILNEMTANQYGVYEYTGEYRFRQTVTIAGQRTNRRILSESFEDFKKFSEKIYENLDEHTAERNDLFTADIQKTLNDIFDLGGAQSKPSFSPEDFVEIPFTAYCKIYTWLGYWIVDPRRIAKYANYICSIWSYFRHYGLSTVEFIKNILRNLMLAIKDGVTTMSKSVVNNLKRAAITINSLITQRNSKWESALEEMLNKTDELYGSTADVIDRVSSIYSNDDQPMNLDQLFDLGNEGGSGKTIKPVIKSALIMVKRVPIYLYNKISFVRKIVDCIFRLYNQTRRACRGLNVFLKCLISQLLETDNMILMIEGVAFTLASLMMALMMGDVSFIRLFLASCTSSYLKLTGSGRRWFGNNLVGDTAASLLANPGLTGLTIAPITLTASKVIGMRLKKSCANVIKDETKALSLIAEEVHNKYYFDWFKPEVLRSLIGISIIIMLIAPKLGISLMIFLILLNDYVKHLRSICVQANIYLSYGSILNRVTPSARYRKLKEIFVKKFDKSLFSPKVVSDEDKRKESEGAEEICRVGVKPQDDDIEIELGYDGKEVFNRSKQAHWGSETSSVNASDHADGLNFSILKPCIDRTQINCSVNFPLSHALLNFPMTDNHHFIPTNDELIDCTKEFYHLEAKKLHDELGKLNNAVRVYLDHHLENKSVKDAVWHMRNYYNDSSVYMNINSKAWYRLQKGDKGPTNIDAVCKYTIDNDLINFDQKSSGVTFCCDELMGMFSNKRCLALESILNSSLDNIRVIRDRDVVFYNKPPGAGKTTAIVGAMAADIKNGKVSIALTHTSNGKKEIIQKLKVMGISAAQKMVYTYDSVLMNDTLATVDKVYCDEIFMVHAGEWLAVMSLFNTKQVRCYGDRNQIPFINRVPHTICQFHKDIYLTFTTFDDNISYRCPVDVCYLLSTLTDAAGNLLYPKGVYPAGDNRNVMRSMDIEPINSVHDIAHDGQGKCISFTRPEREEIDAAMQRSGILGQSVQTVHEVQGGTFPLVYLHRLRKFDNPLYENVNQFIVSISRHTERMKYRVITDKVYDKIGERISAIANVQDYILKEYMFKQRV
uniref:ORF1a polyprotein n=1 Tax=croton golden spot associated virus C TaxID=3072822 RepID=A0AA51N062_9CLOS|nr:ORF1a polyprotein [croton golden spot associated virus C]